MSEVSRVQEPERIGGVGRCGDKALQIAPQWGSAGVLPSACRGDDDSEWTNTAGPPDYATAYASLHEVVRAFLAGERNTRYLRRLHAEIEAELTRPAPTSNEWACDRCGSPRWAGWRNGPEHEGWPRKAQCVPCGHVQELPTSEVSRG